MKARTVLRRIGLAVAIGAALGGTSVAGVGPGPDRATGLLGAGVAAAEPLAQRGGPSTGIIPFIEQDNLTARVVTGGAFNPTIAVSADGRVGLVSGHVTCAVGGATVQVIVSQGQTIAQGQTQTLCTGVQMAWTALVFPIGPAGLEPGIAFPCGLAVGPSIQHRWCRGVGATVVGSAALVLPPPPPPLLPPPPPPTPPPPPLLLPPPVLAPVEWSPSPTPTPDPSP